jgi:hypothetical protein
VTSGLILLALIGLLVAYGITRIRRRMGLGVTSSTWLAVIAAVVLIGLALWAFSLRR